MKRDRGCTCPTCGKPTSLYMWRDLPPQKESEAYRKRIRNLVAQFDLEDGYETHERDASVAIAVAKIMAVEGESPHLQRILATHMERIAAGTMKSK